jgi:iron complex transport system ATP-binding protein
MTDTHALKAQNLSVALGHRVVLDQVSVSLASGRWISVIGPNGAGKSTLLRALAGLVPYQGQVFLQGQDMAQLSAKTRAQQLSWLGQDESVTSEMRVIDLVMLGRLPHQDWTASPCAQDHQAVAWAMQVTQTSTWALRLVHQLSGGERQRVLLARALAVQAQVLLMDEPLANLDLPHQADWVAYTQQLVKQGVTVISVLHELNMALQADEILVMGNGSVVHQGAADAPQTHQAIESVFSGRVKVHPVAGQWVALAVNP